MATNTTGSFAKANKLEEKYGAKNCKLSVQTFLVVLGDGGAQEATFGESLLQRTSRRVIILRRQFQRLVTGTGKSNRIDDAAGFVRTSALPVHPHLLEHFPTVPTAGER